MGSKPRKAFDGIARPQGFIDDAAKAVGKVVKSVKNDYKRARQARVIEKFVIDAKQPPKPKQLPSIKGKSPRPKPSKPNPRAQTTAEMDKSLSKANADRMSGEAKEYARRRMSPYYKTSKNSRNYRG
jgi:hypothetical protein